MHRLRFVFVLELTVLLVHRGYGYSSGAPNEATVCDSLTPQHNDGSLMETESPYDVMVDGIPISGSYNVTKNITVTISGRNEMTFKGFMIQARQYTGDNYTAFGGFTAPLGTKFTCQDYGGATLTQSDSTATTSVEFFWIPPLNPTGRVVFRGSIVFNETTYWDILDQTSTTTQPPTNPTTPVPPSLIDTSECGETKGCYLVDCDDPNSGSCDYGVTWTSTEADGTAFELFGSTGSISTSYLALGLSHDTPMGDDSCTDCLYNPSTGAIDIQMSWNEGELNDVLSDKYLSLVNGSLSGYYVNGMLVCRFTRLSYPPSNGEAGEQIFYPGSDLYHLMVAKGPVSSGVKGMHEGTTTSLEKVNLTAFIGTSGEVGVSPMIKAHGIMMIFAWMVFAGFGMIIPRYYKTAWPGKKWGGKPIWFQLHQPLLIISLILTGIAFILIFVEVKGYSQVSGPAVAHAPLGIIVMALVLLNPVMAHFRPDPKDKRRWLFNICHFAVGLLSHLAATIAIFLAMYIKSLEMPDWCVGVMIFYICWHACIEIILAVHMHKTQRKLKKKESAKLENNLTDLTQSNGSPGPDQPNEEKKGRISSVESYSLFRTALAGLHLAGVIGCSIALSVQIGSS